MEKKMKTYPYIGGTGSGSVVLFHKELTGRVLKHVGSIPVGRVADDWFERYFKNITRDYLSNTYGEVVSPEHAEFIIELCESNGFQLAKQSKRLGNFFSFYVNKLCFLNVDSIVSQRCKKITIPLPPKADKQESSEWPENGDKCISGGEVFTFLCKSPFGNEAVIARDSSEDWDVISVPYSNLKKPKTPEEELRDEFRYDVGFLSAAYGKASVITEKLLEKYDIKKKPQ